jgi:hypothetical protein
MKVFKPNFNNKATRRRCLTAMEWVEQFVSPHKANWLSTREIDRHFTGGSNPISQWLRQQLLIVEDQHFSFGSQPKCKTYRRNQDGFEQLAEILHGVKTPSPTISVELEQQLATGDFEYKEKSDRLWNPLQNIPKVIKRPLMADRGYRYHYDIKAAAPTLIREYARSLGLDYEFACLDQYVADRDLIRARIALRTGLSEDKVKEVINALLNGAQLSHNWQSSIYDICERNTQTIDLLKTDEDIQSLREDFKKCWNEIKKTLPKQTITDRNGIERTKRLSSRTKSGVYRRLELDVIKLVRTYMKKKKNPCLLEHDGWVCKNLIDPYELKSLIKNKLGYVIDIECEIYEYV